MDSLHFASVIRLDNTSLQRKKMTSQSRAQQEQRLSGVEKAPHGDGQPLSKEDSQDELDFDEAEEGEEGQTDAEQDDGSPGKEAEATQPREKSLTAKASKNPPHKKKKKHHKSQRSHGLDDSGKGSKKHPHGKASASRPPQGSVAPNMPHGTSKVTAKVGRSVPGTPASKARESTVGSSGGQPSSLTVGEPGQYIQLSTEQFNALLNRVPPAPTPLPTPLTGTGSGASLTSPETSDSEPDSSDSEDDDEGATAEEMAADTEPAYQIRCKSLRGLFLDQAMAKAAPSQKKTSRITNTALDLWWECRAEPGASITQASGESGSQAPGPSSKPADSLKISAINKLYSHDMITPPALPIGFTAFKGVKEGDAHPHEMQKLMGTLGGANSTALVETGAHLAALHKLAGDLDEANPNAATALRIIMENFMVSVQTTIAHTQRITGSMYNSLMQRRRDSCIAKTPWAGTAQANQMRLKHPMTLTQMFLGGDEVHRTVVQFNKLTKESLELAELSATSRIPKVQAQGTQPQRAFNQGNGGQKRQWKDQGGGQQQQSKKFKGSSRGGGHRGRGRGRGGRGNHSQP